MATMTITLPDRLKEWVDAQVNGGNFSSSSDYFCDLIREKVDEQSYIEHVRQALEEGEASGYSPLDTNELRRKFGLPVKNNAT
jgi:antitoxin ParD1/3/4